MTASTRFVLSTRNAAALAALALGMAVGTAAAQINAVTQIKWPPITGAGTPTSLSVPCSTANYGQPYQNTAVIPNTRYHCASDGWELEAGGGTSLELQHNGTDLADQALLNFDDTTPAPPTGYSNVTFQTNSGGHLSGYVPTAYGQNALSCPSNVPTMSPPSGQYVAWSLPTTEWAVPNPWTPNPNPGPPNYLPSGNIASSALNGGIEMVQAVGLGGAEIGWGGFQMPQLPPNATIVALNGILVGSGYGTSALTAGQMTVPNGMNPWFSGFPPSSGSFGPATYTTSACGTCFLASVSELTQVLYNATIGVLIEQTYGAGYISAQGVTITFVGFEIVYTVPTGTPATVCSTGGVGSGVTGVTQIVANSPLVTTPTNGTGPIVQVGMLPPLTDTPDPPTLVCSATVNTLMQYRSSAGNTYMCMVPYGASTWSWNEIGSTGGGGGSPGGITGSVQYNTGSGFGGTDMGTVAKVAVVTDGAHGITPATGTVATGGSGASMLNLTPVLVSGLPAITVANGYKLVAGVSQVSVSDAASCGDTSTGGGTIKETLVCSTVTSGACTTWTLVSCSSVLAGSGMFGPAMSTAPTLTGTGLTTALNHSGTYSVGNTLTGILMADSGASVEQVEGQLTAAPVVPFTATALLSVPPGAPDYFNTGMIVASSPTGPIVEVDVKENAIIAVTGCTTASCGSYTSLNSFSINRDGAHFWAYRIQYDGTYVSYWVSSDLSYWLPLYKETAASGYLSSGGYNYIGVYFEPVNAIGPSPANVGGGTTLMSWTVTTP
jgi:hypothetical protein